MDDLYREQILEHYKNPHHFGEITDADITQEGDNPLAPCPCGHLGCSAFVVAAPD